MRRLSLVFVLALCQIVMQPCWSTIKLGDESILPVYKGFPVRPRLSGDYIASPQNVDKTVCMSPTKGIYIYSLRSGKVYTAYDGQTGWCDIWGDLLAWTAQDTTIQGMMCLKSQKKTFASKSDNLIVVNYKTWEYYVPPLGKSGPAFCPAIWQDYITYAGTNDQIYLLDLRSGEHIQLTKTGTLNYSPDIGPDLVAWAEAVGSTYQIRAYRISTGETMKLSDEVKGKHRGPVSTDGRYVTWFDMNYDLGLYDAEKREVVTVHAQGFGPSVGNGIIAYQKWLDPKNCAVFAYDIATEKESRISKGCSSGGAYVADGRIVWALEDKIYWVPFSVGK